jgi:hypothetical protein
MFGYHLLFSVCFHFCISKIKTTVFSNNITRTTIFFLNACSVATSSLGYALPTTLVAILNALLYAVVISSLADLKFSSSVVFSFSK